MNLKLFFATLFSVMICTACVSPISSRLDLLGDPAPVSAATRTIVIAPNTKYVNVTGGDIIKFVVGDKSFAWNFDGRYSAFELNLTAPRGMLDHKVIAYVAPNPLYIDDGSRGRGHHGGGHHGGGHM